MAFDYVSVDEAPMTDSAGAGKTIQYLLWGDRVKVLGTSGSHFKVRAREQDGFVRKSHLGGTSLLEFYFIDVGQGDGVLIRTPDHRHILIDGGYTRKLQQTGKNAADFVDWKFVKDYGTKTIAIDALIASHCDADHFGGLWDLLSTDPQATAELDATAVTVEAFYHAGLSYWKDGTSKTLGPFTSTAEGNMFTRLLEDRAAAQAALGTGPGPKLAGEWAEFIQSVVDTKRSSGAPTSIERLGHSQAFLPGFGPPSTVTIKVLAPVEFTVSGKPAIRRFSAKDGINTNGLSIFLRVDYGRARVLLTGDLNSASQGALLQDYTGQRQEFECDVAKACHHGSDDVSYEFLQALRPAVTVISSGDNETHNHPRPGIVAASATTGYLALESDRIVSPLVYSTELARSYKLSLAQRLDVPQTGGTTLKVTGKTLDNTNVTFTRKSLRPKTLGAARIVGGLVYGLVNVRTDGETILSATRNEANLSWEIKKIKSRF